MRNPINIIIVSAINSQGAKVLRDLLTPFRKQRSELRGRVGCTVLAQIPDSKVDYDRCLVSVMMLSSQMLCVCLLGITVVCQISSIQAQAPAPAPGSVLESYQAAAAAYPISAQEEQPLTSSASLPVTCNITLIGLPASSAPAVSTAGRRLQAATNTSLGLSTADIHCTGSYNLTVVGGPAVQAFASSWTGEIHVSVVTQPHSGASTNLPACISAASSVASVTGLRATAHVSGARQRVPHISVAS